ncbi:MAG TPA: ABC transporter permease [Candidatus Binatia bacterium]|nr:ABC transporter permease [Candidatus Binatia bacterium]
MRLESLWGDIRFAFRIFKRSPAVALTVIGTLAVALGLNATAYSFFNAYVVKPAAVHDPGTLYQASWENRGGFFHRFSWTEAEGFGRDMAGVFPETYVSMGQLLTRINGRPAVGELVTGNYFSLLGVPAFRGRMLRPSDSAAPGREPVVVLSHAAWMRLFGGDPAAVGQQLQIRGVYVEIVGIAPEGFVGLDLLPRDFWAPLTLLPALEEGPSLFGPEQPQRLDVVGRLGATQTEGSARGAVLAWAQRTTASNPPETQAVLAILQPAATPIALSFNVLLAFTPLMVAFGLVLLTAAVNLAGLMLSRATVRQREIAIRLSLGASRGRIVRQLFVESLLLALVASLAGFALGRVTLDAGIRAVYATLPPVVADYIRLLPVVPDARVLAVLIAAGIGAAVLFGALPALPATRHAGTIASHGATPDGRTSRLRQGLVVAQITVSALLIVTCGVLLRGSLRLATTDLGLQTRDVIEVRTRNQSNETALATLRAHPLVRTVAAASTSTFGAGRLVIASDADAPSAMAVRMPQKLVSPGYFDVYEIGLVSGRHFTEAEASGGAPVVILSQQAAATLWPGQNAVGRLVRLAPDSRVPDAYKPPSPVVEVVGVARTVFTSWDQAMRATIYSPMSVAGANLNMLVKTRGGNVSAAMRQIDADLSAAAPGVAEQIISAQDLVEARVYPFQAMSWAAGIIGGIALVLTISGIYGVLAYAVARRTKEIGIRMALGESAAGVVGLILKQSMRLCAIGLGIGLTLAVALSTALASTLVMMDTFDVAAFAAGIVIVIAACLVAAFYPARRAAGVEPMVALRIE